MSEEEEKRKKRQPADQMTHEKFRPIKIEREEKRMSGKLEKFPLNEKNLRRKFMKILNEKQSLPTMLVFSVFCASMEIVEIFFLRVRLPRWHLLSFHRYSTRRQWVFYSSKYTSSWIILDGWNQSLRFFTSVLLFF